MKTQPEIKARIAELERLAASAQTSEMADQYFDELYQLREIIADQTAEETKMEAEMSQIKPLKTKQQEIDQLTAFVGKLEPQGYLSMLFTAQLLEWITRTIHNDGNPDIMAVVENWKHESEKHTSDLAASEHAAASALRIAEARLKGEANLQAIINQRDSYIAELENKLAAEIANTASRQEVIESRDDQIIHLKARIYDMREAIDRRD